MQSLKICHQKQKKVTSICDKNIVKGLNRHLQEYEYLSPSKYSPLVIELRKKICTGLTSVIGLRNPIYTKDIFMIVL